MTKSNIAKLIEQIASKKPDLVEFRLDKLHEPGLLEEIVHRKSFPVIATDKSDRGSIATSELLSHAAAAGFDLVDIELSAALSNHIVKKLKSHGSEVIVSFHDRSRTPSSEDLRKVLQAEKKAGGDLCKVVTTAVKPSDNLTILGFVEDESTSTRLVSFAMGPHGSAIENSIAMVRCGIHLRSNFRGIENRRWPIERRHTTDGLANSWN